MWTSKNVCGIAESQVYWPSRLVKKKVKGNPCFMDKFESTSTTSANSYLWDVNLYTCQFLLSNKHHIFF